MFDLTGRVAGLYTVVVTGPDGKNGTFRAGFYHYCCRCPRTRIFWHPARRSGAAQCEIHRHINGNFGSMERIVW